MSREKESIVVISIIQGHATSKQVEQELMHLVGSTTWKWNARQVGDNRFVMRFPTAKLVKDWSKFKGLAMENVDTVMKIEQWSPNLGAKGKL